MDEEARVRGAGRLFEGRCSLSLGGGEDGPFGRVSRLGTRRVGPLMSLVLTAGCAEDLLVRSRGGDTRAATLEEDAEGSAKGWVKEEIGWAERWRAGEDMEAWRREGVKKLVWPATRTLSLGRSLWLCGRGGSTSSLSLSLSGGGTGTGGTGTGEETSLAGRRNETLDSIRDLAFSFSFRPSSSDALPLPLPAPCESTPDSSTGAECFALDFVAVRRLCSKELRSRLNVFGWFSACDSCREEDGVGGSTCFCETIGSGLEIVTLSLATAAAI